MFEQAHFTAAVAHYRQEIKFNKVSIPDLATETFRRYQPNNRMGVSWCLLTFHLFFLSTQTETMPSVHHHRHTLAVLFVFPGHKMLPAMPLFCA